MKVYKSTCLIENKSYVGQTVRQLNERIFGHLYRSVNKKDNLYFHNAIRKYGIENFTWEVLCECSSKDELDEMEKYYIKLYNTKIPNGYNLNNGGSGNSGWKHTEETKKKMSDTHNKKLVWLGRNHTDESKKKISEANSGRIFTDESKKKISESKYKDYEITYPNGEIKIVHGLKQWCEENNFSYGSVKKYYIYNKPYKGYIIRKIGIGKVIK